MMAELQSPGLSKIVHHDLISSTKMNTIPVTKKPKRPAPTFATKDQLSILKAAFDPCKPRTTAQEIAALSEKTGLATKWIVAWFGRQRRKIKVEEEDDSTAFAAISRGHITQANNAEKTKTQAICAPQQVKTEYLEPTLIGPGVAGTRKADAPKPTALVQGKRARGRPKGSNSNKRRPGSALIDSNASALPVSLSASPALISNYTSQAPASSSPELVEFSTPALPSAQSYFQISMSATSTQPQTPSNPSDHSEYILKPLVHRLSAMPDSADQSRTSLSAPISDSSDDSPHTDLIMQNYTYSDFAPKPISVSVASARQAMLGYPSQMANSPPLSTAIPVSSSTVLVSSVVSLKQSRGPVLRSPLQPISLNHPTPSPLIGHYSSSPIPIPDLPTNQSSDSLFGSDEIDLSRNWPLFDPVRSQVKEDSQTNDPLVRDPTVTPLKHLSVLQPFNTVNTPDGVRAIFDRDYLAEALLDDRLIQEDPFQAAMGLVFLRNIGLSW